jgi:hypothetical protein
MVDRFHARLNNINSTTSNNSRNQRLRDIKAQFKSALGKINSNDKKNLGSNIIDALSSPEDSDKLKTLIESINQQTTLDKNIFVTAFTQYLTNRFKPVKLQQSEVAKALRISFEDSRSSSYRSQARALSQSSTTSSQLYSGASIEVNSDANFSDFEKHIGKRFILDIDQTFYGTMKSNRQVTAKLVQVNENELIFSARRWNHRDKSASEETITISKYDLGNDTELKLWAPANNSMSSNQRDELINNMLSKSKLRMFDRNKDVEILDGKLLCGEIDPNKTYRVIMLANDKDSTCVDICNSRGRGSVELKEGRLHFDFSVKGMDTRSKHFVLTKFISDDQAVDFFRKQAKTFFYSGGSLLEKKIENDFAGFYDKAKNNVFMVIQTANDTEEFFVAKLTSYENGNLVFTDADGEIHRVSSKDEFLLRSINGLNRMGLNFGEICTANGYNPGKDAKVFFTSKNLSLEKYPQDFLSEDPHQTYDLINLNNSSGFGSIHTDLQFTGPKEVKRINSGDLDMFLGFLLGKVSVIETIEPEFIDPYYNKKYSPNAPFILVKK